MRASKRSRNHSTRSPSHLHLREDVKADIARSVRTFTLTQFGGTCMMRAVTGNILLRELGLDAKLAVGAMLYRAGPEPIRDTMAYCHHNNVGRLIDVGLCGHVWNELDGDIIDFSCGDWLGEAALLAEFYPDGRPPLQSTAGPPDYLWQPAAPLKSAWRAMGRPALGIRGIAGSVTSSISPWPPFARPLCVWACGNGSTIRFVR